MWGSTSVVPKEDLGLSYDGHESKSNGAQQIGQDKFHGVVEDVSVDGVKKANGHEIFE